MLVTMPEGMTMCRATSDSFGSEFSVIVVVLRIFLRRHALCGVAFEPFDFAGQGEQLLADAGQAARRGAGAPSVRRPYQTMLGICRMAVRDKLILDNPCENVELPKLPRRKSRRVYLTISRLLAFADECSRGKHLGAERRALVLTLGFCGLRWGEAAALKARDLDFGRGVLHVGGNLVYVGARWVEGTPKNSEERDVPMPLIVMEALKPMCGEREPDERVFRDLRGGPIMKQSAAKTTGWWYHALVCLGWPKEEWPTPHDLRHTAASLAVHAGANVKALQRMLGHKNASMTLDVYADLFDSDLMDVARLLDAAVQVETGVEECGQNVGKNVLEHA
ncbi:tyrosine-type recombinase/integrase [Bifidobacterium longum]|uniref:tyrosine-type recombinase/integrase n=1 Tax=Bifidobacterium longum TaxID=216816 RepID=UPI00356B0BD2